MSAASFPENIISLLASSQTHAENSVECMLELMESGLHTPKTLLPRAIHIYLALDAQCQRSIPWAYELFYRYQRDVYGPLNKQLTPSTQKESRFTFAATQ